MQAFFYSVYGTPINEDIFLKKSVHYNFVGNLDFRSISLCWFYHCNCCLSQRLCQVDMAGDLESNSVCVFVFIVC